MALEALVLLCEPVEPPKGELEHIHYFCGNTEIPSDLQEREPRRSALYMATVAMVRAYANIADELEPAGYTATDITRINAQRDHYLKVREIVRKASGETIDLKAYEADMRHLIDTYIEADEPRTISPFDNMSLIELIVETGIADAISKRLGELKGNRNAIAETIENNVRRKIITAHLNDPAYYEKMSALLHEIIAARKARAIEYEEYLKRIAELARKVQAGQAPDTPPTLDTPGKRALYSNLKQAGGKAPGTSGIVETVDEFAVAGDPFLNLALAIDETVKQVRPDGWRGQWRSPRNRSSRRHSTVFCKTRPKWSAFSWSSRPKRNTDDPADPTGRHHGGCGLQGHQERPSERPSSHRPGADLGAVLDEPRKYPRLRHFKAGMDQTAANETPRPGP